jgi:hypothetical protein
MKHPMRDIAVAVFQRIEGDGPAFIAKFEPFKEYPIFFTGTTADAARESASQFAAEAVAKNEATFLARQASMEKARITRNAKKGNVNANE